MGTRLTGVAAEHVAEIFSITENYVFRRIICDVPSNALNKIFLLLHKDIIRYDGTDDNYLAKFKYALLAKKERGRFPDDAEFVQSFSERQVYTMNRYRVYILERFENFGTLEDKDIYRHIDAGVEEGGYSIEHIMPQHLTPACISPDSRYTEEDRILWEADRLRHLAVLVYQIMDLHRLLCFGGTRVCTHIPLYRLTVHHFQ